MSGGGTAAAPGDDPRLAIEPYQLDDDLMDEARRSRAPRLRVYQPSEVMVVLGRGSRAAVELRVEACLRDAVPVKRRRGGGCAVVLDPGCVVVAVSLPVAGIGENRRYLDRLTAWVAQGLRRCGFEGVRTDGVSDLVLGDRKIAGSCVYRTKDMLHYGASLLVAPRFDLIERYLAHPPREPEYRAGRKHAEFLGALAPHAGSADRLRGELQEALLLAELGSIRPEAGAG